MSSISSVTSSLASSLFAKLDTKNQGYIQKTDLESALEELSSSSSSTSSAASADEVFSALDSDSDGKVTESELASSLQQIADDLNAQYDAMRMTAAMSNSGGTGGMGGMPPGPPPSDEGFTKDELNSQLDEIGSSDSKRSSLISNIVSNFDEADTDGDGKVTFKEAMAYDQANSSSTSSTSATTTSDSGSTTSTTSASSVSSKNSDTGFTLDELKSQLEEIGSSDSKRSSLISSIVSNFDEADTDGDGKVSLKEAMAYDQANNAASSTTKVTAASDSSSANSDSSTSLTSDSEFAVMLRIVQLAQSYGVFGAESGKQSLLSTVA